MFDFLVGDDWRLAIGALAAILGVAALDSAGVEAWWLAVAAVPATLWWSLRAARSAQQR